MAEEQVQNPLPGTDEVEQDVDQNKDPLPGMDAVEPDVHKKNPSTDVLVEQDVDKKNPSTDIVATDVDQRNPSTDIVVDQDVDQRNPSTDIVVDQDVDQRNPSTDIVVTDVDQRNPIADVLVDQDVDRRNPSTDVVVEPDVAKKNPSTDIVVTDVDQKNSGTEVVEPDVNKKNSLPGMVVMEPDVDQKNPPLGVDAVEPDVDQRNPPLGVDAVEPDVDQKNPPLGVDAVEPDVDQRNPLPGMDVVEPHVDQRNPLPGMDVVEPDVDQRNPPLGVDAVEQDVDQSNHINDTAEKTDPDPDPSPPSDDLDTRGDTNSQPEVEAKAQEAKSIAAEPPFDWFEPLEEDDDDDDEALMDGSLAGESEKSESVAGSEKASKKLLNLQTKPRRRNRPNEGWEDWPALGFGWKRREVMRQSGSSVGQTDVYYISPQGDRVRSRPGLVSVLEGQVDLSRFDFKSGKFIDGVVLPLKIRKRARKKTVVKWSSSDSSAMEEEDGDRDTPDTYQRLTPNQSSRIFPSKDFWSTKTESTNQGIYRKDEKPTFPIPSSSKVLPLLSINGNMDSERNSLICSTCGITFNGTWYDKQRKKPCCPSCWEMSKAKEHPMIRFRKWLPCGECVSCRNTVNCGQCHNCTSESQSQEPRRRICQKRKCMMPVRRKDPSGEALPQPEPISSLPDAFDDNASVKSENTDSQHTTLKNSDAENLTINIDPDDDDDMTTDDDDDWHKKRKRRSCGECKACLCRRDCGTCDFCIDKPKFGGINKKRQKCRLRQCQRQAMRHLLPFQFEQQGGFDYDYEPPKKTGKPKIHYTYSRKSNMKKTKADSHDEDDDDYSHTQPMKWSFENNEASKRHFDINLKNTKSSMQHFNHATLVIRNGLSERVPPISIHQSLQMQPSRLETGNSHTGVADPKQTDWNSDEDELPMITNVFSYADIPAATSSLLENQLMKLLHSLRASVLPIMWYAILVDGPQLQLIQCSKQSNMSDTTVLIDPGFSFQVTVQKQPLMPTHPLYDGSPALLSTVTDVVKLLLELEKFIVCQGVPPKEPSLNRGPIVLERAPICDFLVEKDVGVCSHCKQLQEL